MLRVVFRRSLMCVVFFATLEVCARFDDAMRWSAPLAGAYSPDLLRTIDTDGIRHNVPRARYQKWTHNRHGFRGNDFSVEKPAGMVRVACLGASESYGLHESPHREWPAQLRVEMARGDACEVINVSCAGLLPASYWPYVNKYVLTYKPDIIVLLINPVFYVTELEQSTIHGKSGRPNRNAKRTLRWITVPQLRILEKAKQATSSFIPASIVRRIRRWQASRQVAAIERGRLNGTPPLDQISPEILAQYRRDLADLIRRLRRRGVQVVLCTYPHLVTADNLDEQEDILLRFRRFAVELSLQGHLEAFEKIADATRAVAQEQHTHWVDLAVRIPHDADHFADAVHFTDRGAHRVAAAVSELLTRLLDHQDEVLDSGRVPRESE